MCRNGIYQETASRICYETSLGMRLVLSDYYYYFFAVFFFFFNFVRWQCDVHVHH